MCSYHESLYNIHSFIHSFILLGQFLRGSYKEDWILLHGNEFIKHIPE